MGVWGTAVFSDDTACDIRGDYQDLIGEGHSGSEATDILLRQWSDETYGGERSVFWLALAATQWKCGRLEERVKGKALEIIERRSDLAGWEDEKLIRKSQAVLEKLRLQLVSPQPPIRKIPRRFRDRCDWKVGELVAYRLKSGRWIIFRVTGHSTDKGGTSPICELLRFVGERIPPENELQAFSVWKWEQLPDHSQMMLGRVREQELPVDRVKRLGIKSRPMLRPREPIDIDGRTIYKCFSTVALWRFLDKVLKEHYDLE